MLFIASVCCCTADIILSSVNTAVCCGEVRDKSWYISPSVCVTDYLSIASRVIDWLRENIDWAFINS